MSPPPPPVLMDELVEEFLRRLPPHDPACLARASAVCKPWRRILASPRFRRSYREFHGTPPVLGFFKETAGFVPGPALFPASHHRPLWNACLDCRHGRALFATYTSTRYYEEVPSGFTVLDPLTGRRHRMPFPAGGGLRFSAAVLCAAAQGCDHHGCCDEEGHFLVIFISAGNLYGATSARVYSSETGAWSDLVFITEPNFMWGFQNIHVASVLTGDAVYFNREHIVKYQLGTRRLSMFEKPAAADYGALVMAEDGVLGFAAVVDVINLAMWSRETAGPDGAAGWAKLRVINLKRLLPDGALFAPTLLSAISRRTLLSGVVEGSQVVFVSTLRGCYMLDLKSGGARMVSCAYYEKIFPYTRFYIPAMEAACTGQEQ